MKSYFRICSTALLFLLLSTQTALGYFTTYTTISNNSITTADWTPPITTLIYNQQSIQESIVNGDFSDNLAGWQADDIETKEEDGNIYVVLKDRQHPMKQIIQNAHGFLKFSYNVHTEETLPGFDDPAFAVTLNDRVVFSIRSEDIQNGETGWQENVINISQCGTLTCTIAFYSGNTGDDESSSFTYLDNITTNVIADHNNSGIAASVKDKQQTSTFFTIDHLQEQLNQVSFSSELTDGFHTLSFWSKDSYNNVETENNVQLLVYVAQLPQITNITVIHDSEHERTVQFTVPDYSPWQDTLSYDIRTSPHIVSDQDDWNTLEHPTMYANSDIPIASGKQQEIYLDDVPEQNIVAIRIKDAAGNFSQITNEVLNE